MYNIGLSQVEIRAGLGSTFMAAIYMGRNKNSIITKHELELVQNHACIDHDPTHRLNKIFLQFLDYGNMNISKSSNILHTALC